MQVEEMKSSSAVTPILGCRVLIYSTASPLPLFHLKELTVYISCLNSVEVKLS